MSKKTMSKLQKERVITWLSIIFAIIVSVVLLHGPEGAIVFIIALIFFRMLEGHSHDE